MLIFVKLSVNTVHYLPQARAVLINAGQANAATVSCVTVARCFTYLSHPYTMFLLFYLRKIGNFLFVCLVFNGSLKTWFCNSPSHWAVIMRLSWFYLWCMANGPIDALQGDAGYQDVVDCANTVAMVCCLWIVWTPSWDKFFICWIQIC